MTSVLFDKLIPDYLLCDRPGVTNDKLVPTVEITYEFLKSLSMSPASLLS